ncbi:plasmid transfer protein TraA [Streptomyces sp. NPDC048696]|uniref:plasmid transfer protein TraA n=1 Tax=Streptomyces sp. NPDC048696 TaxID=3365585 RepID=UPI00371FEE0A
MAFSNSPNGNGRTSNFTKRNGSGGGQQGRSQSANGSGQAGTGGKSQTRTTNRTRTREYHFHVNEPGGNRTSAGPGGGFFSRGAAGGNKPGHSPLGDPEFFNSSDVRTYCDQARYVFLQLSFELAGAAEVLNGALKEIPDPDGRAFGSRARARRVSRRLKKVADDARDAAKNAAATYAAFQREFEPELANYRARQMRQPRRRFDFNQ